MFLSVFPPLFLLVPPNDLRSWIVMFCFILRNHLVSGAPINSLEVRSISKRQQLLAAGDNNGTVHTLEDPWSLRRSPKDEVNRISKFFHTQEQRLKLAQQPESTGGASFTTGDKESIASPLGGDSLAVVETDAEWEAKAKMQYEEYLLIEKYWLDELALVSDVV